METPDLNLNHLIQKLRETGPVVFLESQMEKHPSSKKSFLAALPEASISAKDDIISIITSNGTEHIKGNPWEALAEFHNQNKGWLFGYLGYDLKNHLEDLKSNNREVVDVPDMFLFKPGLIIQFDESGSYEILKGHLPTEKKFISDSNTFAFEKLKGIDKNSYLKMVNSAQHLIKEGDFYEVNISHALEFEFTGDPYSLYKRMKSKGPVPFGAFLDFKEFQICSSSPERFLAKVGNKVWSQPIKGTVSRNVNSDAEKEIMMLTSEKNKAENLMIVDLVRNDLNRIAIKDSVKVKNLFEVQSFETVHQMVSTVECKVNDTRDPFEIIKSCFPMGSMTGAPKISAMKSIENIENYRRGVYSGAIGYINPNNDFDFNVVIRSAIIKGGKMSYPVGGAITSDSIPEEEWEETLWKAQALFNAMK